MRRRLIPPILAVLLSVTFLAPVQADTRPFHARIDLTQVGDPAADPRCPAPMVLVTLTGSGSIPRLGRVSADASHCIIDDPADPNFTNGILVLENPRGSLFLEYSGLDEGGSLEGTFTIVGGTGVYAGATGGGTLTGIAEASTGRGSGRLEGTITVP